MKEQSVEPEHRECRTRSGEAQSRKTPNSATLPDLIEGNCLEEDKDERISGIKEAKNVKALCEQLKHLPKINVMLLYRNFGYKKALRLGKTATVPMLVPSYVMPLTFSPLIVGNREVMCESDRATMQKEFSPVLSSNEFRCISQLMRTDLKTPFFDVSLGDMNSTEKRKLKRDAARNEIELNLPDTPTFIALGSRSKQQKITAPWARSQKEQITSDKNMSKGTPSSQKRKQAAESDEGEIERKFTRSQAKRERENNVSLGNECQPSTSSGTRPDKKKRLDRKH